MIPAAFRTSAALLLGLAATASAQVKLELKHPEGSTSVYKTVAKVNQTMTIMGQELPTKSEETILSRSTVGTRRGDGGLPVTHKFDAVKAQIDLPMGIMISFDSANPGPAEELAVPQLKAIQDVLRSIAGLGYTIVLDKEGKPTSVEADPAVAKKAGELGEAGAKALKERFEADRIKRAYAMEASWMPSILVRPGDSWEKTEVVELGGGQSLTFKSKFEYLGTETKDGKTLDKIGKKALSVTYAMDPNAESPAKVVKSDLNVESSEGTILFDREAGQVVERKGKTQMKGDITLSINGMELPAKLDLTMEADHTLQPASK